MCVYVCLPQAGTQFKASLSELMVTLMSKEPSYIRCIKPNDHKQPSEANCSCTCMYMTVMWLVLHDVLCVFVFVCVCACVHVCVFRSV